MLVGSWGIPNFSTYLLNLKKIVRSHPSRLAESSRSGFLQYGLAVANQVAMSLIPVAVFFVTLERILVTRCGANYTERTRNRLFRAQIMASLGCFILNLAGFLWVAFDIPLGSTSSFLALFCMLLTLSDQKLRKNRCNFGKGAKIRKYF
jgi:hypothetical protein